MTDEQVHDLGQSVKAITHCINLLDLPRTKDDVDAVQVVLMREYDRLTDILEAAVKA